MSNKLQTIAELKEIEFFAKMENSVLDELIAKIKTTEEEHTMTWKTFEMLGVTFIAICVEHWEIEDKNWPETQGHYEWWHQIREVFLVNSFGQIARSHKIQTWTTVFKCYEGRVIPRESERSCKITEVKTDHGIEICFKSGYGVNQKPLNDYSLVF